ncbi:MAG: hypothetical protein JKY96_01410 [Phycisphaerales bacterium]|nr:hypothetical protein [Phycisphaerales bacterium]
MIRKGEYSAIGVLAGFSAGVLGVGAIWLSSFFANPQRVNDTQTQAIMHLSLWASSTLDSIRAVVPEDMHPWLGVRCTTSKPRGTGPPSRPSTSQNASWC